MSEMIERVARVAFEKRMADIVAAFPERYGQAQSGVIWDRIGAKAQAQERAIIRAAIAAMREPTDAMNDAGFAEACRHDSGDSAPSLEIAPATFRAMIDEALKT